MKQLFHSRVLGMRLVIANSALRASLAIYHPISNSFISNAGYRQLGASRLVGYLPSHIQRALVE